ncbi:MAG: hypothetical protein JSU72_18820 [Deltaproteobacteria bacterium]|nr:MAG: hypothetical protein JSU72_18820 [Deltaproteobacteria bacterium]
MRRDPLKVKGNRLVVAMVDPLHTDVLQNLRFTTGMHIDVAVTPQSDIFEALAKFRGGREVWW